VDVRALLAALDLVIVSHGLVLIALKRAADEAGHSSASGIEQLELVAVRASHMGVAVDFAVREGDVYFHLIVGQVPGDEERAARDFELFVVLYLDGERALFRDRADNDAAVFRQNGEKELL